MAAEALDIRLARLEGSFEQIDKRLASLEQGVQTLGGRIEGRIDSLDARLSGRIDSLAARMDAMVLWLAGILVTSLAGVATSLLILLLRP
jgi:hypothetical protein